MYICDFSRSVGAARATTRKTRGLTRSVIRLIVPPFPAVSRPSNTTQILAPVPFTHSCMATSSACRTRISRSYSLRFIFAGGPSALACSCPVGGAWPAASSCFCLPFFLAIALTSGWNGHVLLTSREHVSVPALNAFSMIGDRMKDGPHPPRMVLAAAIGAAGREPDGSRPAAVKGYRGGRASVPASGDGDRGGELG